jgi:thiol-disulfide isomerase/thioredoxin
MRTPFICFIASMALSLLLLAGGPEVAVQAQPSAAKGQPELKVVKYADLGKAIRALKGKVVVVDIWSTSCPPCMREFPHLVDLHAKYAAAGLVCVSVSMDGPPKREKALTFLTRMKAGFPNYLLEEDMGFAFDRWDIKGIPAVFVFRRDGKRAAKFNNDDSDKPAFSYEKEIEPLVRTLIAEKD